MVGREILGTLARGDDLKSRCARPVRHLADECRLVAVGERVDDTCITRAAREQRAGQGVRLHVDHHDVFAVLAAREDVTYAGSGTACRIHDDLDGARGDRGCRIITDERRAVVCRVGD